MVAAHAGTGPGHLKIAFPVLRAVTATEHHTVGCIEACIVFAWSLVGMQPVAEPHREAHVDRLRASRHLTT
eukprot:6176185-Pleurochrysis_carterae.AAC.1